MKHEGGIMQGSMREGFDWKEDTGTEARKDDVGGFFVYLLNYLFPKEEHNDNVKTILWRNYEKYGIYSGK